MAEYGPEGNPRTCKYCLVGEAPSDNELMRGRPFVGLAGSILDTLLSDTGINRRECFITNVFDFKVYKKKPSQTILDEYDAKLWTPKSGFSNLGALSVERLNKELSALGDNCDVIIPLGGPALRAVCNRNSIMKLRGSILECTLSGISGRKAIPTIHPASASYGMFLNQYLIRADLKRARRESKFPEIRRPPYRFKLYPTFQECVDHLRWFASEPVSPLTVDIEVGKRQVSRICFGWSELDVITIPYGDGDWDEKQEEQLWLETSKVLTHPGIVKIFQNGLFDVQFIFMVHRILTRPPWEDIMIMHHLMYPDFRKGLDFLASLHTDQPFYKDMVSHGDIDKPEG